MLSAFLHLFRVFFSSSVLQQETLILDKNINVAAIQKKREKLWQNRIYLQMFEINFFLPFNYHESRLNLKEIHCIILNRCFLTSKECNHVL